MEKRELELKSREELKAHASDLKKQIAQTQLDLGTGVHRGSAHLKNLKRELAQTLTLLSKN